MNFASRTNSRSGGRKGHLVTTAAMVETCEARLLLTTAPNILTPTGTVTANTVEVTWEAVDNAATYELWISSMETFKRINVDGIDELEGTSVSISADKLQLGRIRIWAQATLNDGTKSPWSASKDAVIRPTPTVTGPAAVTDDNTPQITWTAPNGASRFEIWVTDLEKKFVADEAAAAASQASGTTIVADPATYAQTYTVDNRLLDVDGNVVLDSSGQPVLAEVRSFVIPENPDDAASPDRELTLGRYRVWVRSLDSSFQATPGSTPKWSAGYTFQVSARPQNVGPNGVTFQTSPDITWDPVAGATHYEVFVSESGRTGPLFRRTVTASGSTGLQSTQILLSETGNPIVDNGDDVITAGEKTLLDRFGNTVLFEIPYTIQQNALLENVIRTPAGQAKEYTVWVRAIRRVTDLPVVYGGWSTPGRFKTVEAPQITQPVGEVTAAGRIVTTARPVVEWTAIQGAARYEVLVHKFNARPPYLETTSNDNSYTFTENVPAGTYTIWVRGIDARGRYSDWSNGFQMITSGGAPEVITPTNGQSAVTFLNATWLEVQNAVSYEVWVAELGVDFTAINVSGITETSYSHPDPLNNSQYRIWVRALLTDGTYGPWSTAVTFQGGTTVQTEQSAEELTPLLASVEIELLPVAESDVDQPAASAQNWLPDHLAPAQVVEVEHPAETATPDENSTHKATDISTPSVDVLTQIAQNCVDTEWWEVPVKSL